LPKEKETLSKMRRADFCRAEDSRLNSVTKAFEVCLDGRKTIGKVGRDIFTENQSGFKSAYMPEDVRPDMARVTFSKALSGEAERLAWISRSDDMYESTPRFRIECGNIIPDRKRRQGFVFHCRDHASNGVGLPFNSTYGAVGSGQNNMQSRFKSVSTGT